jgi:hypothetical protein
MAAMALGTVKWNIFAWNQMLTKYLKDDATLEGDATFPTNATRRNDS